MVDIRRHEIARLKGVFPLAIIIKIICNLKVVSRSIYISDTPISVTLGTVPNYS